MHARLDEMLSSEDTYYTYHDIVSEINRMGGTISIAALCRYAQKRDAELREVAREIRRVEALNETMRRNPGLDSASAMLGLTINRLTTMLMDQGDGAVAGLDADKAIGHIIRAAQAQARLTKATETREEDMRKAREGVMREVREALREDPELADRLEALVLGTDGGDGA